MRERRQHLQSHQHDVTARNNRARVCFCLSRTELQELSVLALRTALPHPPDSASLCGGGSRARQARRPLELELTRGGGVVVAHRILRVRRICERR